MSLDIMTKHIGMGFVVCPKSLTSFTLKPWLASSVLTSSLDMSVGMPLITTLRVWSSRRLDIDLSLSVLCTYQKLLGVDVMMRTKSLAESLVPLSRC